MNIAFYLEISTICLFIYFFILFNLRKFRDRQKSFILFKIIILLAVFFTVNDTIWNVIVMDGLDVSLFIKKMLNITYFISLIGITYTWFIYVEHFLNPKLVRTKKILSLSLVPLITLCILAILSYNYDILFYFDENGVYHRGTYYILQVILTVFYLLFAMFRTIHAGLKKVNYVKRDRFIAYTSFGVIPLIFSIFQVLFPKMPFLFVGITLGVLQLLLEYQQEMILNDPLTDLNNRNKMNKYLHALMKNDEEFYLIIMDLDNFKGINDKYGHVEGDLALVLVADVLKKIASKYNGFIARFGGDEFILIIDKTELVKIDKLEKEINKELEVIRKENELEYKLELSLGSKKFDSSIDSIPKLLSLADKQLYKKKKNKKRK